MVKINNFAWFSNEIITKINRKCTTLLQCLHQHNLTNENKLKNGGDVFTGRYLNMLQHKSKFATLYFLIFHVIFCLFKCLVVFYALRQYLARLLYFKLHLLLCYYVFFSSKIFFKLLTEHPAPLPLA